MGNVSIIVAILSCSRAIGVNGGLMWKPGELKGDMFHFKQVTVGNGNNAVIMGGVTFRSIPKKFRPLKGRRNIVLSRRASKSSGSLVNMPYFDVIPSLQVKDLELGMGGAIPYIIVATSLDDAIDVAQDTSDDVYIAGGGEVYREALANPRVTQIQLTRVFADMKGDTFFPELDFDQWKQSGTSLIHSANADNRFDYCFEIYNRYGSKEESDD